MIVDRNYAHGNDNRVAIAATGRELQPADAAAHRAGKSG